MMEIDTETAIIGGGQAGVPLARALAAAGRTVVLIEAAHLGGSCVNFGCTPSKALIASARLAADARRADTLGIRIPRVEVDFPAVMARVRAVVAQSKGDLDASFAHQDKVRLVAAHGCLDGQQGGRFRIKANEVLVRAERVVLNTGARTARPAVAGLDDVPVIDAENWIALHERPAHVLMLGGGYIALEMSQALQRLGSQVTVLQKGSQLAEREEREVSDALLSALERDGCTVRLGVEVQRIERANGGVRAHLADGVVDGSHLFLAAGRQPNTDTLGLATVGIQPGEGGYLTVDDRLSTERPELWAAGDIRGGPAFTHTAYDDFRVLRSQLLGDGSDDRCRIVPYAIFTEPELGRVGISEAEARRAGRQVRVGRRAMADSGKARELGKTEGFIKVVADAGTGEILGATALCEQGAEIVQLFVELMNAGATVDKLQRAIHIHPTLAEAAKNAALAACRD